MKKEHLKYTWLTMNRKDIFDAAICSIRIYCENMDAFEKAFLEHWGNIDETLFGDYSHETVTKVHEIAGHLISDVDWDSHALCGSMDPADATDYELIAAAYGDRDEEANGHNKVVDEICNRLLKAGTIDPDAVKEAIAARAEEPALAEESILGFFRDYVVRPALTWDPAPEYISLNEYAAIHGKGFSTVRQKAAFGHFKTAKKIGRNWVIDKNEPYIDGRKKQALQVTSK